ncbi:MFS transporter [Halovivax limisalsi]|uniref:MFS transporter n=1 Tax=Halovivax limisalsi TaxID=1453760 RepID=UPI001FFD6782|nr:MFS transporter [Halovivax limisalsi]
MIEPTDREPNRAVWRFYAYRVSVSNGFYLPVSVVYLQQVRGFALGDIGFVMGAFSVAMVLAEIPTGYVGDRLSRPHCLLLGNTIIATFMAAYTVVETPLAYAALHAFWAVGWAFRSGTADAWLYELLARAGEADEFTRVRGRATTVELGFEAVTAAAAGLLVTLGWSLPFLANALVAVLGIPLLLTAPRSRQTAAAATDSDAIAERATDPDATDAGADAPATEPFTTREALRSLRALIVRTDIRWFVAYAGLFSVLYQVVRVFEQPGLESVGIPVAGFGLLYAAFKLVSGAAAATAGWIRDRLGVRLTYTLLVPIYGVASVALAITPLALVPLFFANRGIKAVIRPIRNQYLNDRIEDAGRATILSGVSMILMLSGGAAKLLVGALADAVGLVPVLAAGGVLVVASAVGLLSVTSPFGESVSDRVEPPVDPDPGD